MAHPFGHGRLCEIFRSNIMNMVVRSYCPDTDFGFLCTVTLILGHGHDIPLGHGQLCQISRFSLANKL